MASSVDDRIVAMHFDNKSFQEKVASTIQSLDKLKASLDFTNAKNGAADLQKIGAGFNLASMASAIDGISGKFSAMGAIAFTALQNITNKAIDTGIQLVKNLSLDQVTAGFAEYETNMNAIQTVLANTKADGTTLDDVNAALKQLNEYSDQTIYNFGEMAKNIGTFTAAGVDLDTSVASIKGIANLAATSGSNSQQAATAMYQLSQAIASGSVKLMDWNSVVNAGMGGEVFQKALFESGKAMGTLTDVPIGQTFEQWTAAGNTFRTSLENGWLTGEVLTNTLQGFTGDLTEAQILAMGYTQDQVAGIMELGQTGKEAATKVKTLTQLISTVKESIGSGWSESFKIIVGDFEEAKGVFTAFSDALGGIAGRSADARNELLQGWKDLGGRNMLIEAIVNTFKALAAIINTVKDAFHDVFPALTSERLFELTVKLRDFTQRLQGTPTQMLAIRRAFRGFFSAIQIGIETVKGIIGFIGELFDKFGAFDGGNALEFFEGFGDKLTALKKALVDGGGITEFFEELPEKIDAFISSFTLDNIGDKFVQGFQKVKDAVLGLFDGVDVEKPELLTAAMDRVEERFGWVKTAAEKLPAVFDDISLKFDAMKTAFDGFGTFLEETFGGIPQKLADIMADTDYDQALDTVNTGFFAGLVLLVKKFLDGGLDFGNGFFSNVSEALGELTGVLEGMQAKLKAEALLDLAIALGVLVASVVVLSLIDSGALTKAMTAMAIGFGQLVTAMGFLNTLTAGPVSAAKLALVASSLIAVGGAILLLSIAVKIFSTLDWEEMSKGLVGVGALLAMISVAVIPLSKNSGGMITTGIGLIAVAVALNILALAVKSFAEMEWESMAQGLTGVGVGLGIIAGATHLMPDDMVSKGVGLLAISVSLNILALALKSMAEMEWTEMAKGMVGFAGALLVIAKAMKLMPKHLLVQGAGLLLISIGMNAIAVALSIMGQMSWETLAKGVAGMAASLLILAGASHIMSGALSGAVAIGVMAISLGSLADAVKEFADIGWAKLAKGLGSLLVSIVALAGVSFILSSAIGPMIGFGIALLALGVGLAAVGAAAFLFATAFSIIATAGTQGLATLAGALTLIIQKLPAFIGALAEGLVQLAERILEALPGMIESLSGVIGALLQLLIDNIPKLVEVFTTFIMAGLEAIKLLVPEFVATGLAVLMGFLKGIEENIGEIVKTVANIITNFLDALTLKVPEIIDSVYDFIVAVMLGVVKKLVDVGSFLLPKGLEFIGGLLQGIIDKAPDILNWFTELPGKILGWIGDVASWLWEKGVDFLSGLLGGIVEKAVAVTNWFLELPGKVLSWIGERASWLWQKGIDFISGLIGGIVEKAVEVTTWFRELPGKIVDWIADVSMRLAGKGRDLIQGLYDGVLERIEKVITWFEGLPSKVVGWVGNMADALYEVGRDVITGLWDGMKDVWGDVTGWLNNLNPASWFNDINPYKGHAIKNLHPVGQDVFGGLWNGMAEVWGDIQGWLKGLNPAEEFNDRMVNDAAAGINSSLSKITDDLSSMSEFNPVITPVLDLSQVQRGAGSLADILGVNQSMAADLSYNHAANLAQAQQVAEETVVKPEVQEPRQIKFEQNIHSPEALTVSDIYRQTRNQIALAKEELATL